MLCHKIQFKAQLYQYNKITDFDQNIRNKVLLTVLSHKTALFQTGFLINLKIIIQIS